MGGSRGARRADRPVYICLADTDMARTIASDLRDHGLRARAFAQMPLLTNAATAQTPSAVLCGLDVGALPRTLADDDTATDLVAIVGDDHLATRLEVAHRGFHACFPLPLNRTALIHRLRRGNRTLPEAPRIAAVTRAGSTLDRALARLPGGLEVVRLSPTEQLIRDADASRATLVIIDGDISEPDVFDLTTALRQHQPLTVIPFVMATAGDKRRFDALAQRCGLDATLGLPIDPTDLEGILLARIRRAETLAESQSYAAQRDLKTGLFRRGHLVDVLPRALAAASNTGDVVTLLRIRINPGPECADTALAMAAERVQRLQPPLAVAARLSDDEIALLCQCRDDEAAERLLNAFRGSLGRVEWQHGGGGYFTADIGMALADGNEQSATALVHKARAPSSSGEITSPTRPAEDVPLSDHWRQAVEKALRENRFQLVYQPISSLSGHPGALFEVFVRMLDEQGQQIRPAEFLPDARQAGLGRALDRWVLTRAVHVLAEQGAQNDGPTLFVKLLPESLADETLAPWLGGLMREERVAPGRLVIEIPHAAALSRLAEATALMRSLGELGCRIAIEHFDDEADNGTMMTRGGFQFLKLAGGLTADLLGDRAAAGRVRGITKKARETDIRTIACLVQDAGALAILWQTGVDYIQGYFMQEPSAVFGG